MGRMLLQQLSPPGGWKSSGHVRVPPLDRGRVSIGKRLLLRGIERVGNLDAGNLWMMLMHNTSLMRRFLAFSSRLMPFGELERRDTELVILRVAWNCRSHYEWNQHVDIGLRAGLSVEDIVRVTQGPDAPGWDNHQVALIRATDEFNRDHVVAETTWQMLLEFLDHRLLLELLMLIGFYEGLAGVLNSTGLPLDTSIEKRIGLATASTHSAE